MTSISLTRVDNPISGCPGVEVLVTGASGATLTITRIQGKRTMQVRGAIGIAPASAHPVDAECGFGIPATYQVEEFDASGVSLGYTATSDPITLDVGRTWVHQPLDPTLAIPVDTGTDTAASVVRAADGSVVRPDGSTVGVWIGGRRSGIQGLAVALMPDDLAAADIIQEAIGGYDTDQVGVLCIRPPAGWLRIPSTLFLSTPSVEEVDDNVREQGGQMVHFNIQGDEVAPPLPSLVAPILTYADLDVAFPSYASRDEAYGSYLAQDRDYSKAGLGE